MSVGKSRQEGDGLRRIAFLAQEDPERRVSARNKRELSGRS